MIPITSIYSIKPKFKKLLLSVMLFSDPRLCSTAVVDFVAAADL